MTKTKSHKLRAKDLLESLGWTVADVEVWIRGTLRTRDLWNFADLLACHPEHGIALVQVASAGGGKSKRGSDVGTHISKMIGSLELACWLAAGGMVEVIGIRNAPLKSGSTVAARYFELEGDDVVAFDGSLILPRELVYGRDSTQKEAG